MASSRLRELLRETEGGDDVGGSLEGTPRKGAGDGVVVSRFSGSTTGVREIDDQDHDEEVEEEEAQTPHEEYKTPKEEQSPFSFERDGGMF